VGIEVLEEALSLAGRSVALKHEKDGWRAMLEPWEEVRTRKIERAGNPPIVMYELKFDNGLKLLGWKKIVQ